MGRDEAQGDRASCVACTVTTGIALVASFFDMHKLFINNFDCVIFLSLATIQITEIYAHK